MSATLEVSMKKGKKINKVRQSSQKSSNVNQQKNYYFQKEKYKQMKKQQRTKSDGGYRSGAQLYKFDKHTYKKMVGPTKPYLASKQLADLSSSNTLDLNESFGGTESSSTIQANGLMQTVLPISHGYSKSTSKISSKGVNMHKKSESMSLTINDQYKHPAQKKSLINKRYNDIPITKNQVQIPN